MSIASDLSRIQGAKAGLKVSIENKGVTVPTSTLLDGYPALVDQISSGGLEVYNIFKNNGIMEPSISAGITYTPYLDEDGEYCVALDGVATASSTFYGFRSPPIFRVPAGSLLIEFLGVARDFGVNPQNPYMTSVLYSDEAMTNALYMSSYSYSGYCTILTTDTWFGTSYQRATVGYDGTGVICKPFLGYVDFNDLRKYSKGVE